MALIIPKSWNDCGMDWENPDPSNFVYYTAIVEAIRERYEHLYGDGFSYDSFFEYSTNCRFYDRSIFDILWNIFSAAKLGYYFYNIDKFPSSDLRFDINTYVPEIEVGTPLGQASIVLKSWKALLDSMTVIGGSKLGYTRRWESDIDSKYDTALENPPFMDYFYPDAIAKWNEQRTSALENLSGDADMWYLARDVASMSNYIQFYISAVSSGNCGCIVKGTLLCAMLRNTAYNARLHIIHTEDYDERQTANRSYTFFNSGLCENNTTVLKKDVFMLTPSNKFIYESAIPLADYPVPDIPKFIHSAVSSHEIGNGGDVTFLYDFNCEGGFKFRPG